MFLTVSLTLLHSNLVDVLMFHIKTYSCSRCLAPLSKGSAGFRAEGSSGVPRLSPALITFPFVVFISFFVPTACLNSAATSLPTFLGTRVQCDLARSVTVLITVHSSELCLITIFTASTARYHSTVQIKTGGYSCDDKLLHFHLITTESLSADAPRATEMQLHKGILFTPSVLFPRVDARRNRTTGMRPA